MKAIIEPGKINAILTAPPSKSMTQRAYAAALLHTGTTNVLNAGNSEDEIAALDIIQRLGARITKLDGNGMEIVSSGVRPISDSINCGESGLAARLFTPIAALSATAIRVDGKGSLLRRPLDGLVEALSLLQVALPAFNGYLPFTMQGPIQASSLTINGKDGSQFLSGLLFALTEAAQRPIVITVDGLKSRPYVDMTLAMLALAGRPVAHNRYREFYIDPARSTQSDKLEIAIEGDWSSASFFLVAGAISGSAKVEGLNINSCQADKAVLDVLRSAGAGVVAVNNSVTVQQARLNSFEFDATHCPDLFPVLSILAACAQGESSIRGLHRLFHKESNRVESITEMLQDFAVPWSAEDDTLFITGVPELQGTVIDSYHDHRIAMAATIGALKAGSRVDILHAGSVRKSYPGFFNDFSMCGGKCIFIDS